MPNILQTGAAWLGSQLQTHTGRSVSILQSDTTVGPIIGSLSLHDYEYLSSDGLLTLVSSFDWTFVAGDLTDIQLHKGAIVSETIDDVETRYEVMPIGNRPAVESLDSSRILLLVHTKRI